MPFNFLREYLVYNSGNECPRDYHIWSALVVLAATVHKRIWVNQGYYSYFPNLYVCLVGKQGARKSTAKDIASDLFTSTFPNYPVAASVTSREDIIKFMTSDACKLGYRAPDGSLVTVRPYVAFVNELKNFVSFEAGKMIEFLTDIYDRKTFKSSTIKRGLEDLVNPCVNILACETPTWITEKLKSNIISGGFARRIIYVYVLDSGPRIAFPERPDGHTEMWTRLRDHLLKITTLVGEFQWEPEARDWWKNWYDNLRPPEDEMMAGYYSSKHAQLIKICMLLAAAEEEPRLFITRPHLEQGLAMLDVLEENMPKLFAASGRNELAIPIQKLMEHLEHPVNKGWLPEKTLMRLLQKDLNPMETIQVIKFLVDTDQIRKKSYSFKNPDGQNVSRVMIMTRDKFNDVEDRIKKGLPL